MSRRSRPFCGPGETTVEVIAIGRKQSAVVLLWLVAGPGSMPLAGASHAATFDDHYRDPARCDGVA
jgi:hypothetical protein